MSPLQKQYIVILSLTRKELMQIGKIFEGDCVSVKFGFICRFSFCLPYLTSRVQQESYLFQGVLAGQPKQQLNQLSLLQWRKSQTLKSRIKFYFNYSAGDDTGEVLLTTAISLSRIISVAYFRQQLEYVFSFPTIRILFCLISSPPHFKSAWQ